ncbi:hypothetical protein NBRGN_006_00220 [Nocardia brasiliensis NBRC 14402]|uniref:hypothetical protein n=1 Tax=Nocardia brasiliensis TaxID=37326 RepID=UPI00045C41BE|nr:hypothetical protein [Nocardia brasiliensis]ASF11812.1 hypothetical protein CEQ30_35735 [Nocardia brasiliensis]GAJ79282.1 hypothetical protein NBRGN_006_00220 [Nocardia brasiliensis NBRC 14402]
MLGLVLAAGFAFAAIAAAAGGTYPLAIALAVLAVPFAIPTVLQVLGELLIYLMIPAAVVGFVLLLPILALSPAARTWARRRWHRYRAHQL